MKTIIKYLKLIVSWFKDEEDWEHYYVDSQMNHGQGPRRDENEI